MGGDAPITVPHLRQRANQNREMTTRRRKQARNGKQRAHRNVARAVVAVAAVFTEGSRTRQPAASATVHGHVQRRRQVAAGTYRNQHEIGDG